MSRLLSIVRKGAAVSLALVLVLAQPGFVYAATGAPRILNYQGRLMDGSGTLLGGTGTAYCFKFSIYDDATVGSGTKLWPSSAPSTMTATVKNGVFSVGIGDTNAGGDLLDFDFQSIDTAYLNVEVATKVGATCAPGDGAESFETLSPRNRIDSSGYAINANTVGGFTPSQEATGSEIPALAGGKLVLGSSAAGISATTTNQFTIQGDSTGNINFFNTNNTLTSGGDLTLAGLLTTDRLVFVSGTSTNFFSAFIAASAAAFGATATSSFDTAGQLILAGGFDGPLQANNGLVSATSSVGVLYGGTGIGTAPAYGEVLLGNGAGGYTLTSTSSLGISGGTSFGQSFEIDATGYLAPTTTQTLRANGGFVSQASSTVIGNFTVTGQTTLANASTTAISSSYASSTQGFFGALSVGSFSGILKATAGAISSSLVSLTSDVSGILGIANGGTGTSTAPSYGQVLVGNAAGGYDLVATSSLGFISSVSWGQIGGLLSNQTDLQAALDAKLGLSAWYSTTTDGLNEGPTNLYFTTARADTSFANNLAATTTTALTEGSNLYYTDDRVNTFINSSTTIPKTYTDNTFTGNTTLAGATSSSFAITNLADTLLYANGQGSIGAIATSSLGLPTFADLAGYATFGYLFPNNATTTGLGIYASSTIGDGTAAGGLTVSGTATTSDLVTTGTVRFAGLLGGALATNAFGQLYAFSTSTWTFASSTLLGDANTFSGNNTFTSTITGDISGNAGTATKLATARNINGVAFDGTADITVASTTLLGDSNTWSGLNAFANASSTLFTAATAWIPKLANLASAGFVKTAADGTLSVDTNTYLTTAVSSLQQTYGSAQTGAVTLATSSDTNLGLSITNTGGTFTFAPSWTGFLAVTRGGTGTSTAPSYGQVLVGNAAGGYDLVATSSLGISSGSSASSTLLSDSNTFSGFNTFSNPIVLSSLANAGLAVSADGTLYAAATTTFSGGLSYSNGNVTLDWMFPGNATTTKLSFDGGLATTYASTTQISSTGNAYLASAGGSVGIGTTTPWGMFSINPIAGGIGPALVVGSSTKTLFAVDRDGTTSVGDSTGTGDATFQFASDANAWSFGYRASDKNFVIASSTNLSGTGVFSIAKGGTATFYGNLQLAATANCAGALQTDSNGKIFCGAGGGGSGSSLWATTTNETIIYPAYPSAVVVVGQVGTTTTGTIFEAGGTGLFRGGLTVQASTTASWFNATSTTATSTFAGGIQVNALDVTSTTATSTFANGINLASGCFSVNGVCVGGSGASGILSLGSGYASTTDTAVTFSTTTQNFNGLTFAQNITASNGALTFTPNVTGTLTAAGGGTGINNPSAAGILLGSYAGGGWQQVATSSLGLLTTNVAEGSNLYYTDTRVGDYITGSSTVPKTYSANTFTNTNTFNGQTTLANASTTAISSSYASSTQGFFGALSVGSLSGILKATAGAISSSLVSLTSDVSGILGIANGGTGTSTAPAQGQLLVGNAAGAYDYLATSTLGIDLADTTGSLAVSRGGTGQSSYTIGDILYADGAGSLTVLPIGSAGQVLKVISGMPQWSVDLTTAGGGGGSGLWATTTDDLAIYPVNPAQVVLVGTNATSSNNTIFEVAGRSYFSTRVGIASTSPNSLLSINGAADIDSSGSIFYSGLSALSGLSVIGTTNLGAVNAGAVGASSLAAGTVSTSTIQGDTTGTSTIQGFVDVLGTNSTSSFSGGVQAASFKVTGSATSSFGGGVQATGLAITGGATSTFANGLNLSAGCFSINGTCIGGGSGGVSSVASAGGTLTVSSPTGAVDVSLNLSHANTWTGLQTITYASSTAISSAYASSTDLHAGTATLGSLTLGSLSGVLRATAGAVSTGLVNLASEVSGVLSVANGGTGWAAIQSGTIPYGNGSGALATTTAGTAGQVLALLNGIPTWTSTTTFSYPFQYSAGNVTLAFGTTTANSWNALQQFSAGITSYASSTIGNGTAAGGLTVSGNATTTGSAYFAGSVGIGKQSPSANFTVQNNFGSASTLLFEVSSSTVSNGSSASTLFSVDRDGITTVGNSAGAGDAVFQYASDVNAWAVGYKSSDKSFNIASSTNLSVTAALSIAKNGNATFTGSGGTCTINGSGSCTSDIRLKTVLATTTGAEALRGLAKLDTIAYRWTDLSFDQSRRLGVIAQEVKEAFPELVGSTTVNFQGTKGTYYTVDYGGLTAPLIAGLNQINGVYAATDASTSAATIRSFFQGTSTPVTIDAIGNVSIGTSTATSTAGLELCLNGSCITSFPYAYAATTSTSSPRTMTLAAGFAAAIQDSIARWFADAANGIQSFFAAAIHAHEIETNQLCVTKSDGTNACVTGDEFAALLSGSQTAAVAPATVTAPILQINGNNPAIVQIGSVYNDLGAMITGPESALNLGIAASVDGATSTPISDIHIDTSVAATYTILYSVTDQDGITGSATRTVVVFDPNATSTDTVADSSATTSVSTTTAITTTVSTTTASAASVDDATASTTDTIMTDTASTTVASTVVTTASSTTP